MESLKKLSNYKAKERNYKINLMDRFHLIWRTNYHYELKGLVKYGDFRLLGNKDPHGKIIFTILTDHRYKKM